MPLQSSDVGILFARFYIFITVLPNIGDVVNGTGSELVAPRIHPCLVSRQICYFVWMRLLPKCPDAINLCVMKPKRGISWRLHRYHITANPDVSGIVWSSFEGICKTGIVRLAENVLNLAFRSEEAAPVVRRCSIPWT
jgi:hypothetical protein